MGITSARGRRAAAFRAARRVSSVVHQVARAPRAGRWARGRQGETMKTTMNMTAKAIKRAVIPVVAGTLGLWSTAGSAAPARQY